MQGEEDLLPRRVLVMQIITFALVAGVVSLLVVGLVVVFNRAGQPAREGTGIVTWVAVGVLAVQGVLANIIPSLVMRANVKRIATGAWKPPPGSLPGAFDTDEAKLLAIRQVGLVIGLALLQGASFLGFAAYLVEAQPAALAVVGVGIVLMIIRFPTQGRIRAWLGQQAAYLAEMRLGGDRLPPA